MADGSRFGDGLPVVTSPFGVSIVDPGNQITWLSPALKLRSSNVHFDLASSETVTLGLPQDDDAFIYAYIDRSESRSHGVTPDLGNECSFAGYRSHKLCRSQLDRIAIDIGEAASRVLPVISDHRQGGRTCDAPQRALHHSISESHAQFQNCTPERHQQRAFGSNKPDLLARRRPGCLASWGPEDGTVGYDRRELRGTLSLLPKRADDSRE